MNIQLHDQMTKTLDKYTPVYLVDTNYTICLLETAKSHIVSFGIAKCNPNLDEFLPERGREIALARAVKKLREQTIKGVSSRAIKKAKANGR